MNSSEPRGFNFDVNHHYLNEVAWPALAHRFPSTFAGIKWHRTWSGLYEQCELDGNPIIGALSDHFENFMMAAALSSHGMMHAPAAGRWVAEPIVNGRFESIDLAQLGYERVLRNAPHRECGLL